MAGWREDGHVAYSTPVFALHEDAQDFGPQCE